MIYIVEILEIKFANNKVTLPIVMYKNPTEYEFYNSIKPIDEYINDNKITSDITRGCIDKEGNIYIWNPDILHDYLNTREEFREISNDDKFTCIVVEKEQGYSRLNNIKNKLIQDGWIN